MSQSLSENRYPDCLSMELTVTPVQSSEANLERADLYLTLNFNEQWEQIGTGWVKLALAGGHLQLKLKNAQISGDRLPILDIAPISGRAIAEGTLEKPIWVLTTNISSFFKGSLDRAKLGTVELIGKPAVIEVSFTVSASELQIIEAEGLWSHNISPNRLAILERKIALDLLKTKFQPYLSRVLWQSDHELQQQPNSELNTDNSQLLDIIARIVKAETDDFLELAQIVSLNPAADFVGAKLLSVNLNGADLSSANLRRVYLRGANLCDIDLSNADLNEANLGGVDLSGAYLSEVDFGGANLRRASLALANLSGAYLAGANLSETNLSNANLSDTNLNGANLKDADLTGAGVILSNLTNVDFSGAKVINTRFKDNPGLTEQMKQELQQGGAIFED